jgi:hypothetical protein
VPPFDDPEAPVATLTHAWVASLYGQSDGTGRASALFDARVDLGSAPPRLTGGAEPHCQNGRRARSRLLWATRATATGVSASG